MVNIVPQCETISCYLDGKILLGKIEEVYVPNLEILTINPNARTPALEVELKVLDDGREILEAVGRAGAKPMQLEVRASIKNNYGEMVQASWKCRGKPVGDISQLLFMPTTFSLNAVFYEYIIDDEEKYYIDIFNGIQRIDGVDK